MDPDRAAPQNQGLRHAQQETADSAHDGKAQSPPENSNARDVHCVPCQDAPALLYHDHSQSQTCTQPNAACDYPLVRPSHQGPHVVQLAETENATD